MKFRIARTYLTDESGRVLPPGEVISHHLLEANDPDEALRLFLRDNSAEVIGEVQRFPGCQAMATARSSGHVFTVEINPVTDSFPRIEN